MKTSMNRTRVGAMVMLLAGMAVMTTIGLGAATPLPDVPLVARGGAAASSGRSLPTEGRWLLVHVKKECGPCDALLARIQGEDWDPVPPRLVVIVSGATPAEVEKMAAARESLSRATWYADESGGFASALQVQEAPVVLAINRRTIQWTLAGVLSGSTRMRDALTAWVKTPIAP